MMRTFGLLGILLLTMASCATIFTGTEDTINFKTSPEGAIVYKDGIELCTTPCTYSMKRSLKEEFVEFELDGYETRLIYLDQEFNTVSILNLFGILGWAIDAVTGAIFKYDRKAYDIELRPVVTGAIDQSHKINIDTKQKIVEVYVMQEKVK